MMMQGLRVAALFLGYSAVGMGGDMAAQAAGAMMGPDDGAAGMEARIQAELSLEPQWTQSECRYEARREVSLDVSSARSLMVRAGSGELEITGREGLNRVEAVARACASDEEELAALLLTLDREGDEMVLSAHYPDRSRRNWRSGNHYARLDLVVAMPKGMAVDVDDSSGGMTVSGTGALRIDDSSGSIWVEDVAGALTIDDSSGEIDIRDVQGDVDVDDGSGGLNVTHVAGTVRVRDGSGSMDIEDVGRDVVVEGDGSGSISVRDVRGDFQVRSDGSGSIRHSGVAGTVEIPRNKRRGTRGG